MLSKKTFYGVIIWSVISAAFIGPGTVTTAATAGTDFNLDLLWAVVFATIACILLQELSARITISSGLTLGEALIVKYGEQRGQWLKYVLGVPVILGCAAYEAGNILGGVSGLQLVIPFSFAGYTVILTIISAIVLWTDQRESIGWLMTFLVGLMGIAFIYLAWDAPWTTKDYALRSVTPSIPPGSELIALALVGTTIVPYNLFLGSGISKGQTIPLMRTGLTLSVMIGGVITAAILVAGTAVPSFTSFDEIAGSLRQSLGDAGGIILGTGLFAAGFSSAITSPYAASIIAGSVFAWNEKRQRLVWAGVLFTGFAFGISGVRPVPVILSVQALNGLVLPLLTAFLILLINDRRVVKNEDRHHGVYNVVLLLIFSTVLFIGMHNVDKSMSAWLALPGSHFAVNMGVTALSTLYLGFRVLRSGPE